MFILIFEWKKTVILFYNLFKMKKHYLALLLFTLSSAFSFAQSPISITTSNMPVSGDTIRYSVAALSSVGDYTTTGANMVWNFDTLRPLSQAIREFKSGNNTPYSIIFGFTAYGEKIQDTVPIPTIPIPGVPAISITDLYNFYSKTSTKFIVEGLGVKLNGIPVPNFYSNEDELYFFPLNYTDRDSSTFRFSTISNTLIPFQYVKQGHRITEADGWGTVTTPYGTQSCLRVVTTQYSIDTLKGTITLPFVGPTPFNFGFPNYVRSYQWLTNTEKIPFFEVSGSVNTSGVFTPNQARYRDVVASLSGINESKRANNLVNFYPNPTNGELFIENKNNTSNAKIEVYDIEGKLVKSEEIMFNKSQNSYKIDLNSLNKGIYMINVITKTGKQTSKISIQ